MKQPKILYIVAADGQPFTGFASCDEAIACSIARTEEGADSLPVATYHLAESGVPALVLVPKRRGRKPGPKKSRARPEGTTPLTVPAKKARKRKAKK